MSVPLPLFVAIPLVAAFVLPVLGRGLKPLATLLANLVTLCLLVLALLSIGKTGVYEVGSWSIPLGINLVLDGLSSLLLLAISVSARRRCCSARGIWSSTRPNPSTSACSCSWSQA
jgi:formate hydrogenlyase subunit 3/multisubunit Na+/H+ antiporter MnhD subunit